MDLSIVFPAFDESNKIKDDVIRASSFLISENINGELIVVDDGSKDNTYEIAKSLKSKIDISLSVIKHKQQSGKGAAVKSGILASKGDLILYSDVGNIVPFRDALTGMNLLKQKNADIANGSRKLPDSKILKKQKIDRIIVSKVFNIVIRKYMKIPNYLTDTQCGFKIYKNEVGHKLFSDLKTTGFLFEIEIILRAIELDYKIIEFPLEWKCDRDSRISFKKTSLNVIKEMSHLKKMFL